MRRVMLSVGILGTMIHRRWVRVLITAALRAQGDDHSSCSVIILYHSGTQVEYSVTIVLLLQP